MHIVAAMMKHETNSFSPIHTDWARFEAWSGHRGPAARAAYEHTRMPLAAYIRLAEAAGHTVTTPLAAEAMPGGPVDDAAYDLMCTAILEAIAAGCDAAMLDLHGAMIARSTPDGEGSLLRRIRALAPDLPICVTCDLHCNLTAEMVAHCTALIGYKTYPHTDLYEVAAQVGGILLDALDGHVRPVTAWGNRPLLAQTLRQGTDDAPMAGLVARARALEAGLPDRPPALAATVFGGFPLGDMADAGLSAVVVHDAARDDATGDGDTADAAARAAADCADLLDRAWADRAGFIYRGRPLAAALAAARDLPARAGGRPVLLLDHADNCGSGGTQDVMTVIGAVLAAGLDDVAVAAVWDPAAAAAMHRAGSGARIDVALGGRTAMPRIGGGTAGRPLRLAGTVLALSDGRFRVDGPMYTGVTVETGPTAVLGVEGPAGNRLRIVVVSRHHEPWDTAIFSHIGIDPARCRYLLLKSRIHYRAGFAPIAGPVVPCDGDGATPSDNDLLRFERLRRPIYPLDPM